MTATNTTAVPFGTHMRTAFLGALISLVLATAPIWAPAAQAQSGMKRTPMTGVTVEIVELKRIDDKTVGLVYAVTNDTAKTLLIENLGLGGHFIANIVALVDYKNGKRYGVGSAGKNCLCSTGKTQISARSKKQFWAHFAAPPADVDKITVAIGSVPPFYNVPIAR